MPNILETRELRLAEAKRCSGFGAKDNVGLETSTRAVVLSLGEQVLNLTAKHFAKVFEGVDGYVLGLVFEVIERRLRKTCQPRKFAA